jgi:dihydrodipicolinate synthase/N-acetylneuraminate lyase
MAGTSRMSDTTMAEGVASALTSKTLRGVWGTILLPLEEDDRIDQRRLGASLDVLVEAGLDGIYAHGTAGEFHTLDEEEYDAINELVASRCAARGIPFQLGASHMSGQTSLARIRRAASLSPAAIQVILPDWVPVSEDEAISALGRMAEVAAGVPLVLYNPPHAKTRLSPQQLGRIASLVPSLIGIKVAGGDADWYAQMRQYASELAWFVAGHTLATGLARGAAGSYSNVACLSPVGAVSWYRMMGEHPDDAVELEHRIQGFLDAHVLPFQADGYSNPALDKLLAHIGDWAPIGTRTRWPYRWISESLAESLRPVARAEVPELFPR